MAQTAPSSPSKYRNGFIIHPVVDLVFFIFSPLLALLVGFGISGTDLADRSVTILGHSNSVTNIFLGTLIFSHLVLVFLRSHLNKNVFMTYPLRFTLVPVLLFAGMMSSLWLLVTMSVLATWWDVYHSGMQTFGLGRIYDSRGGNDAKVGRVLDLTLNQLLYAGPILGGLTLWDHISDFEEYEQLDAEMFLTEIPYYTMYYAHYLTWAVLLFGIPFLCFYVYRYWRLAQEGYSISAQKVALYASTGLCSILTWGFNSFGEAFFIMNTFHAIQYFALVWWTERKNLTTRAGLLQHRWGRGLVGALCLVLAVGFGLWAEWVEGTDHFGVAVITTVAILHFWYDGFIWSVRKKQV
ncbi:MAG: hypothetical protein P8R54_06560 [Myxococcota bacterium]|nr:hypothetical protein [Myxococcota bacterium]